MLKLLASDAAQSGWFVPEKIPELIAVLREAFVPFGGCRADSIFRGDALLSAVEKKELGLNARARYTKEFVSFFKAESFQTIDPADAIERMHRHAYNVVFKRRDLQRIQKLGVRQIRIVNIPQLACGQALEIDPRQRFDLQHAPQLPLRGCSADNCQCLYRAIIPGLEDDEDA